MRISGTISRAKNALAKRRRYNGMVAEILSLSDRDLADINGNRDEMLAHVRQEVYGR